jgi:hypothetical protein
MTRAERRVLKTWLIVTALAAIPFFFLWFQFLLMVTIIGIPIALLLSFAPTVWLYLTAALLLYVPLRFAFARYAVSRKLLAAASALIALGAGIAVPILANRAAERRVDFIMAGDMGAPPSIAPVGTVALLADRGMGDDRRCWDRCQRLLFSGIAHAVLRGSRDALGDIRRSPVPLLRHAIVPISRGCDNAMLIGAHAAREEWQGRGPAPYLWEKLDDFAARGECFRSDETRDARADLYLVSTYNLDPDRRQRRSPRFDFRLVSIEPFQRREIFRRERDRLVPVMRRTQVSFNRLAVPLLITPPFSFDIATPGHWGYARREERGSPPTYDGMMGEWLRNNLRISGLGANRAAIVVTHRPAGLTPSD